nr:immunoglobulin light chain junction region [Macaca mulatta]MOX56059.1 immunoglobulin light chain junction region [Macaca mulatta]MOX57824.1 immunoglobulin light chain junction region [Macaca mulatta]
CHQYSEWITF